MIRSDRYVFIGAHVTEEVKQAIVTASYKHDISMSHLIFSILKNALVEKNENADNQ